MSRSKQQQSGFSLVEFIVILTLFAIMASVVSFDFQSFRTRIDRTNLATDIALAFRQMQVYGISSSNRQIGSENFDSEAGLEDVINLVNANLIQDTSTYGVFIDLGEQRMTLFQDNAFDGTQEAYDQNDIIIDQLQISGENEILRLCITDSANQPEISSADASCEFSFSGGQEVDSGTFTATFKRPFPDAVYRASAISDGSYEIQMVIMVIGPNNAQANELRYLYLDAAGLIQPVRDVITD